MNTFIIKKNSTISYVTGMLISIVCVIGIQFIHNFEFSSWCSAFAVIIIITCILQSITLFIINKEEQWLSICFLIAAYLFHLSHVILCAIGYDFGDTLPNLAFDRFNFESAMSSMEFSYVCINMLYLGLLLNTTISKRKVNETKVNISINPKLIGLVLLLSGSPFFIYNMFMFFKATVLYGYTYAAGLEYNYYTSFVAKMVGSGVMILMLSARKNKALRWLLLGEVLFIFSMLSGQRAYYLMNALLLMSVYIVGIKKPKFKLCNVIIIILGVYILCLLLNGIRDTRENGMNISLLLDSLKKMKNPFLNIINEFGITSNIVTYTYASTKEPTGGIQLFASLLIMIPGVATLFPNIDFSLFNVTDALDAWNFGGSFVADIIFDFGRSGAIVCILIGLGIGRLYSVFLSALNQGRIIKIAWLMPIICEVFFWNRSTFYKIPRDCFFTTLVFGIIIILIKLFEIMIEGLSRHVKE